jgi:hypothetical protein
MLAFCALPPGWTGLACARVRHRSHPREVHVVDEMLGTFGGDVRRSELRGSPRARQENS